MKRSAKSKTKWVAVSGGFDPLHVGHVRMFKATRKLGDKLVVIVNNDHWLIKKKGFVFMPERERLELLKEFPFIDKVVLTKHRENDPDMSVNHMLRTVKPAVFANGGDRKSTKDIPETVVCKTLGIRMVFNVGKGGKVQSSSWMVSAAAKALRNKNDRQRSFSRRNGGKG